MKHGNIQQIFQYICALMGVGLNRLGARRKQEEIKKGSMNTEGDLAFGRQLAEEFFRHLQHAAAYNRRLGPKHHIRVTMGSPEMRHNQPLPEGELQIHEVDVRVDETLVLRVEVNMTRTPKERIHVHGGTELKGAYDPNMSVVVTLGRLRAFVLSLGPEHVEAS